MAQCSVDGCERKTRARGLCNSHYTRAIVRGELQTTPRKIHEVCEKCGAKHYAKGFCRSCYGKWKRGTLDEEKTKEKTGPKPKPLEEHGVGFRRFSGPKWEHLGEEALRNLRQIRFYRGRDGNIYPRMCPYDRGRKVVFVGEMRPNTERDPTPAELEKWDKQRIANLIACGMEEP